MPTVTIEGPAVQDMDKRRELVKRVTDAVVAYFGRFKPGDIVVLVKENPPECVAVGGELVCDRRAQE
jgi:4-oxalocrotonate tautomerase